MAEIDYCEVAVVGGGVVGAAAALALTQRGFDVRLVERGMPPQDSGEAYDLRVYAISPASARWLSDIGVWESLPKERVAPYESMRIWEATSERALNLTAADIGRSALGWIVEQNQILRQIWARIPSSAQRCGQSVVSAVIDPLGSRLRLSDGTSLQARLVLAADGAASPLREAAGIATEQRNYEQRALVAHVQCDRPHGRVALQRFLPGGPLAFLPLADGRRSIVWSLPADEAEAMRSLPLPDFRQALASAIQFEVGVIGDCSERVCFPLHLLHAHDYVHDSLVLLGDSAHVVHPLAGQGVNLGLADAAALTNEVIIARAAGRDWGALRLLQRYERARKADNLEMLALTDALDRGFRSAALQRPLGAGLALLDRSEMIKRILIRRAVA